MLTRVFVLALAVAGCSGDGDFLPGDAPGHDIEATYFDFSFAHDPNTQTYQREIGGAFDSDCRLVLSEDADADLEWERIDTVLCSDEQREAGQRIVSDGKAAIYEAEAGSIEDPNRHCSLYLNIAPSGPRKHLYFSKDADYGPEVQEMFTFFMDLYDAFPPE